MSRNTISKPRSIHAHETKQRKCLAPGCDKSFLSSWRGHRICGSCRELVSKREADGLPVQWEGAAHA